MNQTLVKEPLPARLVGRRRSFVRQGHRGLPFGPAGVVRSYGLGESGGARLSQFPAGYVKTVISVMVCLGIITTSSDNITRYILPQPLFETISASTNSTNLRNATFWYILTRQSAVRRTVFCTGIH